MKKSLTCGYRDISNLKGLMQNFVVKVEGQTNKQTNEQTNKRKYGQTDTMTIIITKGHSSLNIVNGVTIFVFCTMSNHGLHLY